MNACAMFRRCLRAQCPDLLGIGAEPRDGEVPPALRYGPGEAYEPAGPVLDPEPTGDPEARQW